jgi:twitching motility two-component system response regulator PilG
MCEEVVVIDDSPVSRLVVEIALRRQGVSCRCFANGTEALRALEEDPQLIPRVIVMELSLKAPGIGGHALVRLLRVCPRLDETAIVILTSRAGVSSRLRARLAGADEYLVKPFVRKTFLSVVLPYVPRPKEQPEQKQSAPVQSAPVGEERHAPSDMYPGAARREQYAS